MTSTRRWAISPHAAFVDSDDRVVAVDLAHLTALGPRVMVGTAAVIWRAVVESAEEDAIISKVVDTFDVGIDEAADDIRQFLAELAADGLVCDELANQ